MNLPALPFRVPAPTLLDRVIGYVAPRAQLQRLRARAGISWLSTAGGYLGARTDRRMTREWRPGQGSADADTLWDLPELRGRSRDLARNAPIAAGAINTKVRSTVGSGIRVSAQIDRELLGLADADASAWERKAERICTAWFEQCDIEDRQDFYSMQDTVYRSQLESGDLFVLRRFLSDATGRPRPGDLLGLKVQLIEADRVSNPNYLPDTDRLRGGVQLDANGAPLQYHILDRHPGEVVGISGGTIWTAWPRISERGELRTLHIARRLRPGQTRGVPELAGVIEPLKTLDRYSEAEITAAVISAFFTVFIKSTAGGGGTPTPGLAALTAPEAADHGVSTQTGEYRLAPGAIVDLLPGEEVQIADPKRPNAQFDPFVMSVLRQVGANLELPYEVLILAFTASYSASRASLLEAWRGFLTRRQFLVRSFCQPCYEWVLTEAIERGLLKAPGFERDPLLRRAWLGTTWTGPSQGQIDPLNEANAAKIWIDEDIKTRAQVTAETTGGDWERNHAQRVKEEQRRRADGLAVVGSGSAAAPSPGHRPGAMPPDPDGQDDEEQREEAA
jgi:lambda family phage portal protein